MATASTIDLLPPEIKAQLQQLLQDPRCTQLKATAEINAILEAEGHPERVTKSAVNRYAVKFEELGAKMRQGREIADVMIGKLGAAPQGKMGLLINEMLRSLAFELTLKMQEIDLENPETLSATIDQVKALALGVQRLEQSSTINVRREGEIRKNEREKALQDAIGAVKDATSKAPIDGNFQFDPKTIDYVTTVLYGLQPK
ncbi:MAG: DUF3486 family protein [Desulfuromonadaceae bacterium]